MSSASIDASPDAESWRDALRVQAAAVVAQQAALVDAELRLREREAALARQEEEIAAHPRRQRRQALERQKNCARGPSSGRKRAAHADLAAQQAAELTKVREEAADLVKCSCSTEGESQRLRKSCVADGDAKRRPTPSGYTVACDEVDSP
ncbi:MAG: hypothetical protein U0746_21320 [Gemmataceae bacterium]